VLNKLFLRQQKSEPVIAYEDFLFPASTLQILLAQSASAEVRRRFEPQGNVFDLIKTDHEFQHAFIDSYMKTNLKFFQAIRPHIPKKCHKVLDIGCGIGLLDLFIYRNAPDEKPDLYLFDKSVDLTAPSSASIAPTGFNDLYVFTASLAQSARFLELNGVADRHIHLCEVGTWSISNGAPFDLVFSRKSWGFHYPLSEYLDEVVSSVAGQGALITDVRADQGGERMLQASFRQVDVLEQGNKSALMMARWPKDSA
jgi:SAM-dependent methyltransferase